MKLIQDNGTPLTEGDHISARRLSRALLIVCVMSFLESCSSVDFYADLRDQFIEALGRIFEVLFSTLLQAILVKT